MNEEKGREKSSQGERIFLDDGYSYTPKVACSCHQSRLTNMRTQNGLGTRLENERVKMLENEVVALRGDVQRLKEILVTYISADLKSYMKVLEKIYE